MNNSQAFIATLAAMVACIALIVYLAVSSQEKMMTVGKDYAKACTEAGGKAAYNGEFWECLK